MYICNSLSHINSKGYFLSLVQLLWTGSGVMLKILHSFIINFTTWALEGIHKDTAYNTRCLSKAKGT